MSFSFGVMLEAFFLTAALSIDAMVSSFAYGTNRIKIPFRSVLIINLVCSSMLGLSLLVGRLFNNLIPEQFAGAVCFTILFLLGVVKLFDSFFKSLIKKSHGIRKNIKFSMFSIRFILNIYANPEDADQDASNVLSSKEAIALAAALSLDSLAVGFGAGLIEINVVLVLILSFAIGLAAVIGGCFIGNKIAERLSLNLSWISGLLLIILAFMKLS